MFQTVRNNAFAEITEKKSKFICNIFHVESIQDAEKMLKEVRRKYNDARHNCYVYKIKKDDVTRISDDGEPSGTAALPMLNILDGRNLSNILVVVTRYFGGILLGTGGLVRAYSLATMEALNNSNIVYQEYGLEIKFLVEYKDLEEVKYQMKNRKIEITDISYGEKIEITVEGSIEQVKKIINQKISDRIVLDKVVSTREKYVYLME